MLQRIDSTCEHKMAVRHHEYRAVQFQSICRESTRKCWVFLTQLWWNSSYLNRWRCLCVCFFFFMQRLFAFARWCRLRRIHINARLLPNLFSTNVIIWFTRPFPPPFKLVWKFIHHTVDCFVAVHSNFYLAGEMT